MGSLPWRTRRKWDGRQTSQKGYYFAYYRNFITSWLIEKTFESQNSHEVQTTDGVAMGSPLSPVIANFFMEDFEKKTIEQATHKPVYWFRYVDDTFVIWPHGQETWQNFWTTSVDSTTRYSLQGEKKKAIFHSWTLTSTEILVGSLGHKVYQKPTHTNLYLHQNLHHHPAKKQSVLASLITEPKLCLTRIPSPKNENFSPPSSRTMHTALNRYDVPWNRQHGLPRPMINSLWLHTYRTPKQRMADSADCWPNTILKVSPYHLEKYSTTFHQSRMRWV